MRFPRSSKLTRRATQDPRIFHFVALTALILIVLTTAAWIQTEATVLQPVVLVFAMALGWSVKRLRDHR